MDHTPTPPASPLPHRPVLAHWHGHLDLAGAWLSLACAAHCLALPLLLALVPATLMALRSFQHPGHGAVTLLLAMSRWESLFALLAASVALLSTGAGWRRHRRSWPLCNALGGSTLLLSASLYLPLKESLLWHGAASACGGVMLATAHLRNRRAARHSAQAGRDSRRRCTQ